MVKMFIENSIHSKTAFQTLFCNTKDGIHVFFNKKQAILGVFANVRRHLRNIKAQNI